MKNNQPAAENIQAIELNSRGVYSEKARHSCEDRNPEMSVPSRLDARLRGHDAKKNTPASQVIRLKI